MQTSFATEEIMVLQRLALPAEQHHSVTTGHHPVEHWPLPADSLQEIIRSVLQMQTDVHHSIILRLHSRLCWLLSVQVHPHYASAPRTDQHRLVRPAEHFHTRMHGHQAEDPERMQAI